jgi:hypothetical protein
MYNNAKRKLTRAFEDNDTSATTATAIVATDTTMSSTPTLTKAKGKAKGAASTGNTPTSRKRKASAVDVSPGSGNLADVEPSPAKGDTHEHPDYPGIKRYKLVPRFDAVEADDVGGASTTGGVKEEETGAAIKNEGEDAMAIDTTPTIAATKATPVKGRAIAKPRAPRVKKDAAGGRPVASKSKSKTPGATTATQSAPSSTQTSPGYPPSGEPTTIPDEEMAVATAAMDAYHNNYPVLPEAADATGISFEQLMNNEELAPEAEDMN